MTPSPYHIAVAKKLLHKYFIYASEGSPVIGPFDMRVEGRQMDSLTDLADFIATVPMPLFTQHDGDCTIYSSLVNGNKYDGICTCGYGRQLMRNCDESQMLSDERRSAVPDPDVEELVEVAKAAADSIGLVLGRIKATTLTRAQRAYLTTAEASLRDAIKKFKEQP